MALTAAPNIHNDLMTCEICHVAVHDLQKLMAENATQVSLSVNRLYQSSL